MNIGSCCGGDFQADIAFRYGIPSPYDIATVKNGFCHNQTLAEYALTDKFAAIKLPSPSSQEIFTGSLGTNFPLELDYINRSLKTHVYPAGVRALRFRFSGSVYAQSQVNLYGPQPDIFLDPRPSIFARLLELPFSATDDDTLDQRDWKRVELVPASMPATENFFPYVLKAASGPTMLVVPDANCLGFFWANNLMKPRPTWGGTRIPIYGDIINFGIAFKTKPTDFPVFAPLAGFSEWFQGTGPTGGGDGGWGPNVGDWDFRRGEPHTIYSGGYLTAFNVKIGSPPLNGDTISMGAVKRTWKTTVIDPTTEIPCITYDPHDNDSVAAALQFANAAFNSALIDPTDPAYIPFVIPDKPYVAKRGPLGFRFANVVGLESLAHAMAPMSATGEWSRIVADGMGADLLWKPIPTPWANISGAGTISRTELLPIPLTGQYDQTFRLPTMRNPFIVELFWGSGHFAASRLVGTRVVSDPNLPEYKFTVKIDAAA